MTKQIYILLMVLLGFFFMPTQTNACGVNSEKIEKSCCQQKTSTFDKKDCCESHAHKEQSEDNCSGKCENSSCICPSSPLVLALPIVIEIKNQNLFLKKTSIPYTKTYNSSGFGAIWQPPKIS